MKINKLAILLFVGVLSFTGYSQSKFTFGVQGGLNYSSLRFEDSFISEHDSEIGYLIGVSSEFYLKNRLSIKAELNFEKKIVSVFSAKGVLSQKEFRIYDVHDFITIPVLLKYKVSNSKSPFFINGGVFLGYFLSVKERINNGDLSEDLSEYNTNFDFGLSLGVGKVFSLNESNELIVEVRNNLGLTNINQDPVDGYIKTNSLNLTLGWKFKIL